MRIFPLQICNINQQKTPNFGANPETILKGFKSFSKEEYLNLSKSEINCLKDAYNELAAKQNIFSLKKLEQIHDVTSNRLKEVFDSQYGKNNYIVLILGRSLSSIGKMLGYKIGEKNVINIPFSSGSRFYTPSVSQEQYKKFLDKLKNEGDIKDFINYLETKKISKSDVELSGKEYILTDFCVSGKSLKGANQLFKSDFILGNKMHNIHAQDALKIFPKYSEMNTDQQSFFDTLRTLLLGNRLKPYSFVKQCALLQSSAMRDEKYVIKDAPESVKLFWFKLLDNFMENIKPSKVNFENTTPEKTSSSIFIEDLNDAIMEVNKKLAIADNLDINDVRYPQLKYVKKRLNNIYTLLTDIHHYGQNSKNIRNFYTHIGEIEKFLSEIDFYPI